jgi:hypothetical protein
MQLRETYPSREYYREFWGSKPHFPAEDWNPWVEAFLDYELWKRSSEPLAKNVGSGQHAPILGRIRVKKTQSVRD